MWNLGPAPWRDKTSATPPPPKTASPASGTDSVTTPAATRSARRQADFFCFVMILPHGKRFTSPNYHGGRGGTAATSPSLSILPEPVPLSTHPPARRSRLGYRTLTAPLTCRASPHTATSAHSAGGTRGPPRRGCSSPCRRRRLSPRR